MKNVFTLLACACICTTNVFAQTYCDVMSAMAYSTNMPGITNFVLNTIDRNSEALECGQVECISHVKTGVSTPLEAGTTYLFSITHTRDPEFFPNARNNIRIWIDFNHDGEYDIETETAASLDYEHYGTSTGTITIPGDAVPGRTGMRVTAKMSSDAGHAVPTPCDDPPDPIGYHGEIEDYMVDLIVTMNGVNEENGDARKLILSPNPLQGTSIVYFPAHYTSGKVLVRGLCGGIVQTFDVSSPNVSLNRSMFAAGTYMLQFVSGGELVASTMFVVTD